MVVTTDDQIKGRGQRHHEWDQQPGLDLAWTLAHKRNATRTTQFDASAPFALNKSIALRVCEVVESILPAQAEVGIKWPNDIMLRSDATDRHWQKCAGLLIENTWRGSHWEGVALGIGMNVHSTRHTESGRIALSDVGHSIPDLQTISKQLCAAISPLLMAQQSDARVESAYQNRLIGRDAWQVYTHREVTAKGQIQGVDNHGRLCMQWELAGDLLIVQDSKELSWDWLNR